VLFRKAEAQNVNPKAEAQTPEQLKPRPWTAPRANLMGVGEPKPRTPDSQTLNSTEGAISQTLDLLATTELQVRKGHLAHKKRPPPRTLQ